MGALPTAQAHLCCCSSAGGGANGSAPVIDATSELERPEKERLPPAGITIEPALAPLNKLESKQATVPTKPKPEAKPLVYSREVRFTIVQATGLRNADWGLFNKSDPYCTCEIPGKPLSKFMTEVINDNLNPAWNAEGVFADYDPGKDDLAFRINDKDVGFKIDDFLGDVILPSKLFHPHGFDGKVPLQNAGAGTKAFLQVRIAPAEEQEAEDEDEELSESEPEPAEPEITTEEAPAPVQNFVSEASEVSCLADGDGTLSAALPSTARRGHRKNTVRHPAKASGNKNLPSAYRWLEEPLLKLASNEAPGLGCKILATDKGVIPVFFVLGACPNALCGMQAVMFAADSDGKLPFWWVKPSSEDSAKLEVATLCQNDKGPHKNDPGRSRPFYQPLAELFEQGCLVRDWRFGLETVERPCGTRVPRAYVQREAKGHLGDRLYMHLLWQEDWTSNPFARRKYIKGKLVYQKKLEAKEFYFRQYEIHDGAARIDSYEEGPITDVLLEDRVKVLWDLNLG